LALNRSEHSSPIESIPISQSNVRQSLSDFSFRLPSTMHFCGTALAPLTIGGNATILRPKRMKRFPESRKPRSNGTALLGQVNSE
jgi:hypothetical protein